LCVSAAVAALLCLFALGSPALAARALQVGEPVPFRAESPHPYPAGPANLPAWEITIQHPGATFISVHFERFELGRGDRLVVRSADGAQRYVYTERGRAQMGEFWATHIMGDAALVELFAPGRGAGGWGVSIDQYSAGFADLAQSTEATESVCTGDDRRNAVCYETSEPVAYEKAKAVARLLIEGTLLCTGWLVGDEGHLMTNDHCINDPLLPSYPDKAAAAANTDYEFMGEAPTCSSPNNTQLGYRGPIWAGAATLVKATQSRDYALVHLAGNPQDTYGSFKLEPRAPVVDERFYLPQHGGGRAKMFGIESTDSHDESGYCEIAFPVTAPCGLPGEPNNVGYYCDTEGGSSGSPVVSYATHQVIALHHCGSCDNTAVPITEVINDLGPLLPPSALAGDPDLVYVEHLIDDTTGNGNGVADPYEILTIPVFIQNIDGGVAAEIVGTLSTTTPGVTILDDTASFPDLPSGLPASSIAPHFQVQLADTIPCGTVIDFDLDLATSEGPFALSFTQTVGLGAVGSGTWDAMLVPTSIPDADPAGVADGILVPSSFPIGDIQVSVDITHGRIGDLILDLESPSGTTVRLHDRSGGQGDDIVTTYDAVTAPDGPGTMDDFNGEDVQGTWILTVSDNQSNQVGTLNGWSIQAAEDNNPVCSPVPCEVTAQAVAIPDTVCEGGSVTLADAGSTFFGQDCSGTLEYRFEIGGLLLQDWSTDPDAVVVPPASTVYTVFVRDQVTLAQGAAFPGVTVEQNPVTTVSQVPELMCVEFPGGTLDAGPGFASYVWMDSTEQVVGTSQTLALGAAACGQEYTVELTTAAGCSASFSHTVTCESCVPEEVSGPGAVTQFRLGVDALGTVEFELLPELGLSYTLYVTDSIGSMLAGEYTHRFCDLENNTTGTWSTVDADTARWTPLVPQLIVNGLWVVVAERDGLEGSYGTGTGGVPRPPDADKTGSVVNVGCP
jgi:subtilisin-like proprotein convertase family protein